MEYEDTITIPTPEGIELSYTLAGLGSRFLAQLLDALVRAVMLFLVLVIEVLAQGGGHVLLVPGLIASFLAIFAYDIVFEVWGGGRTPGKRWTGLRVVMATGQPVGFAASAVRNLVRIVDMWATAFIVGILSILLTKRNQRLGDLAAATIVVRERRAAARSSKRAPVAPAPEPAAVPPGVDVTAVSAAESAAIREFLRRRDSLTSEARRRVAQTLADSLAGKVGGIAPDSMPAERLLETIAAAKAASGYGSR